MRVHCFFPTPVSVEGLDRGLLWLPTSQNLLAHQQQTSRKMHPSLFPNLPFTTLFKHTVRWQWSLKLIMILSILWLLSYSSEDFIKCFWKHLGVCPHSFWWQSLIFAARSPLRPRPANPRQLLKPQAKELRVDSWDISSASPQQLHIWTQASSSSSFFLIVIVKLLLFMCYGWTYFILSAHIDRTEAEAHLSVCGILFNNPSNGYYGVFSEIP